MSKQLKKSTVEFIKKLFDKELEAEWVFDAPKPSEVEYILKRFIRRKYEQQANSQL